MSGKPRTAAQLQLNQNRRNAAATLKSRGKKVNLGSVAALVKSRRAGKSNDEYFAGLGNGEAAGHNEPLGMAVAAVAAGNKTAKKPRTAAQAASNARRAAAIAELKAAGLKANAASVKRHLNAQATSGAAATVTTGLAESEAEALVTGAAAAATAAPSGHVAAGKKAAKSEKGAAWLRNVDAAKIHLNSSFAEVGLSKKASRANAMRLAKTRRNNPAGAKNVELNILAEAQGNVFNKEKKAVNKPRTATRRTAK